MKFHKYYFLLLAIVLSTFNSTNLLAQTFTAPSHQNVCSKRTVSSVQPCSVFGDTPYNFHLPFTNISNPNYRLLNGELKETNQGTATLSGTLVNVAEEHIQFSLSLVFSNLSQNSPIQQPTCLTNINTSNFYFYNSFQGQIVGLGDMAGANIRIQNRLDRLQLGYGANWASQDTSFGGAANIILQLSANPTNGFIISKISRGQTEIPGHLSLKLTDCNICASLGGDTDGDGICDDKDCEPNDASLPAEPGSECDDGDMETENDVIQEDGCSCVGELSDNEVITYQEECARRTAFNTIRCMDDNHLGIEYGGYILLKGQERHYYLRNGQFAEYANGTAILVGEWVNIADDKIIFDVHVTLSGRTSDVPADSPKGHHCLNPNESTYYYYTQTTGTLIGRNKVAGAKLTIGRAGPAFQFGVGANVTHNELTFGGAGWLTVDLVDQPTTGMVLEVETSPYESNGDININLSGDPFACVENRGTAIANCRADITVTANIGQSGKAVTWDTPTFTTTCNSTSTINGCGHISEQLNGFEYVGEFNGSKYFASATDNFTYTEASTLSAQNGGHLVTIGSTEENTYLKHNLEASEIWIGFVQTDANGVFGWANGESSDFINWSNGEPNDSHNTSQYTGANHTVFSKNSGEWLDRNKNARYKFVMEIPCSGSLPSGATTPMTRIQGFASGNVFPIGSTTVIYEGRDACGNVTNCTFKVNVLEPVDPCAGGKAPQTTVAVEHPLCDQNDGKIIFSFEDVTSRTNIEFSLDGGQTFPLYVRDDAGIATFDNLAAGSYHLYVRWGNNECPVDLGIKNLEEQEIVPGTTCDDGNINTENDIIQSDGCTCEGTVINSSGCDDLLKNTSFENGGVSPWRFNNNTRYNRNSRYRADGDWMVWIYKKYSNSKDAAIYQDAVAIPRAHYSFSFYAGTHKTYYNHVVAIEFYNQYGAKLKRKAIQIDFDVDGGNVLKEYHLEETAPAGATKIRFIGTTSGDYLKLDAICVQVDKSNVQSGSRATPEQSEQGLSSETLTLNSYVKNEGVVLDWFSNIPEKTASFVVEKSVDGGQFEFFNEISDLDDGILSITDAAPDYGTNSYRIIQKLETGEELISNIRTEKFMLDPASITLYPNPAIDDLNLRIGHSATIEGTVRVFSPTGLEVYTQTINADEKHLNIDVSTLKNGMYFLLIEAKNRKPIERQFIVESLK